jgi:hypothetical protein
MLRDPSGVFEALPEDRSAPHLVRIFSGSPPRERGIIRE